MQKNDQGSLRGHGQALKTDFPLYLIVQKNTPF